MVREIEVASFLGHGWFLDDAVFLEKRLTSTVAGKSGFHHLTDPG